MSSDSCWCFRGENDITCSDLLLMSAAAADVSLKRPLSGETPITSTVNKFAVCYKF